MRTVGLLVQLIVIARLCGAEELGLYSFALALTTPIVLTLGWHLRVMLSVDADHHHAWSAYRRLRTWSHLFGFLITVAICWCWSTAWSHVLLILLVYVTKCVESMSELGYGVLQRVGHTRAIASGNALRAILVTVGLCLPLLLGCELELAVGIQAAASMLAYVAVELPRIRGSLGRWSVGSPDVFALLRQVWPLGLAVGVGALGSGMPRLFLTDHGFVAEAGVLLVVINLMSPASLLVTSMQQSFGSRMADAVKCQDRQLWRRYLIQSIVVGYLACLAVGLVAWSGLWLLTPILGWQIDISLVAFAAVVVAGGIQTHQTLLGTGLDSMRQFSTKLVIQFAYVAAIGVSGIMLIPSEGLLGACLTILVGAVLSLAVTVWPTFRAAARLFPGRSEGTSP